MSKLSIEGISFPPTEPTYKTPGTKSWNYTEAQWKELYTACLATTLKQRTAIAKAYFTSMPTIQKYAGVSPKSRKNVAKNPLVSSNSELDAPPKAPVLAKGQKTLRKPFAPLPYNKNRVLAKLEAELDAKREEVVKLETALSAINALDVEMIKAILA